MTLACQVCGTPAVPGARFCFHCGAALDRAAEAVEGTAERRVVTVLFGDLSDFTAWAEDLDPERVGVITDSVLAELARAVTDVGGHVDKLTGDGIMAVFGAPTAHEDDPERAVRAAASMQAAVRARMAEELGGGGRLGLRVGVNTGEVLAGVQAAMAYTVVGDTVNTASRLADAAQIGSVYAGRTTALATMSTASWRALPPLRLKGKREPVPAYELIALRPPGSARLGIGEQAAFVGREAEIGRLIGRVLEVVERGEPASSLVVGEAGVGKTRLVEELGRFAGELPAGRVLWGRCPPFGTGRGLAPLTEWVRTACGISDADSPAEAEARVRRTLARLERPTYRHPLPTNVADRLLALLGLADGAPVPRDAATPGALAELGDPLVDAVFTLLDGLTATGPLVCVVDDLQWATSDLVTALAALFGRLTGPALLVGVGRGEVLDGALPEDWWRELPNLEVLPVVPLDAAATDRLLRAYLGGAELDPPVRDLLTDRAQGNPFFLAELLHLLVDRGVLRVAGDTWRLDGDLPDRMLPAGVQSVLVARVDELDATAKAVLRDASVVGTRFDPAMLAVVDPLPADELTAALEKLVSRGLLMRAEADGSGDVPARYAFAHTLARDVVYAGIPKAERAHRHAQVALWASEQPPAVGGAGDVLVGAQAEQAIALATEMGLPPEDPAWRAREPGFRALVRLGQAALARDDNPTAEMFFGRALDLGGTAVNAGQRGPALTGRAAARVALLRLREAEADLAEPLRATEPAHRAAAMVVRGELLRRRGVEQEARRTLVSALALAGQEGADRVTAEALRQLGMLEYLSGRLHAAEQRFREAADLAQRVHDRRGVGWALQHLAWSATTRGDWALAEDTLRRASAVFGDLDDTGGLSWCAGTEAFVRLLQGRFVEARELAQSLLSLGEAMGERWGVAACQTIDAFAAAEMGSIAEGSAVAATAWEEFRELSDTWGQAMALIARGAAERGAGQPARAVATLTDAVACSVAARHAVTEALASTVLGYCRLDLGDAGGALAAAEAALAAIGGLDLDERGLTGPTVLRAQALRGLGRREEARELLARVASSAEGPSLMFPRRQALAHYAGVLLESGSPAAALLWAHRALAVPAQDVRSRVVALRVLGACYAACGDPPAARAALRQAAALAYATEQVSERPATDRAAAALR